MQIKTIMLHKNNSFTFWGVSFFILNLSAKEQIIDDEDLLVIDQVMFTFHLHNQHKKKEPLELEQITRRKKEWWAVLLPGDVTYLKKPKRARAGWLFFPFYGHTNYPGALYFNRKEVSLLGLVGLNKAKGCITIIFRGSHRLSDWYTNVKAAPLVKAKEIGYEGYVHRGYWALLNSCLPGLHEQLNLIITKIGQEKIRNEYKFIVGGHSLGAALALLAGLSLLNEPAYKEIIDRANLAIRLFGTPAVCFSDRQHNFSAFLKEKKINVKNIKREHDWVAYAHFYTRLLSPFYYFWQVVQRGLFLDPVVVKTLPASTAEKSSIFAAHFPENYRKRLYKELKKTYTPYTAIEVL